MADKKAPRKDARACVMGTPVFHSLSPKLHGYWLRRHGVAGAYTAHEVTLSRLSEALAELAQDGWAGCNLTLPLKEAALPLMDALDDSARVTGAVNTVVIRDGKKTGYNSDGFGFMEGLRQQHPGWDGRRVVLLGAGGAARAIAFTLKQGGAENFVLVNRTPARAEAMARDLGIKGAEIVLWEDRAPALEDATLLVNATSLGMAGREALELGLSALPKTAAVCDIVYRPLMTPLLQAAQGRGHPVVTGLPMLLHQGRLGFRHWFGVDPAVTPDLQEELAACVK